MKRDLFFVVSTLLFIDKMLCELKVALKRLIYIESFFHSLTVEN